jgi:hypothetical protein
MKMEGLTGQAESGGRETCGGPRVLGPATAQEALSDPLSSVMPVCLETPEQPG